MLALWLDVRGYGDDVWIEGISAGGPQEQRFVVRPAGARWNLYFLERGQEDLLESGLDETALVDLLRPKVERMHRPRP